MVRSSNSKSSFWASWIVAAVIMLVSYYQLSDLNFRPIYPIIAVIASAIAVVFSFRANPSNLIRLLSASVALWLWCVLLAIVQGADKPLNFSALENIVLSAFLVYLFCYTKISVFPLYLAYYAIAILLYFQYFVVGIESYGAFGGNSGAINTIVLLSVSIAIQLIDYRNNQRIALLPSLSILPISILSWNRTGLITTILYILTVFFIGVRGVRKKGVRVFLYLLSIALLSVVVISNFDWFSESALYSKFEQSGVETGRTAIWGDYFRTFDLLQLIMGRAIDEHHALLGSYVNAHNSFIMLHAQTGFIAIIIIVMMIKVLIRYWKSNRFVFFLFVVIILRGSFDMAYFFHPYDFVICLFMLGANELVLKPDSVRIRIV